MIFLSGLFLYGLCYGVWNVFDIEHPALLWLSILGVSMMIGSMLWALVPALVVVLP